MPDQLQVAPRRYSRLLGVGSYLPRRSVSNKDVCRHIDSTEEWIETRSGIRSRRFASAEETLLTMATAAGRAALTHAGLAPEQVSCVVLASMSNLVQTPPLSIAVAHELGLANAAGFDLSAACAGFCHALGVAGDMVAAGNAEHVLVIGAERMTDIVERTDRTIAFLFADGAGAVVVGPAGRPGIGPTVRGADGSCLHALRMTNSWGDFRADPTGERPFMRMDGKRVFRWAVDQVVPAGRRALAAAGIPAAGLGAFIPHQANLRMIDIMASGLGLPPGVAVARDIVTSGNTSAASIPIAMERMLRDGAAQGGTPALLVGFGAGLNYAGQVVLLPGPSGQG